MRTRLVSAAFGIIFAIAVLYFYNSVVLNIVIALIILWALYEVLITTKYIRDKTLFAICSIFSATVPFFIYSATIPFFNPSYYKLMSIICYLFIFTLFVYLLKRHKTMRLEVIGTCFMLTLLLSFSFSCIIFTRDKFLHSPIDNIALFYIILIFAGAWATDAGAYFIGRIFGKHKLSPEISPKKTIEGAIGGFVISILVFIAAALIFKSYCFSQNHNIEINYITLIITSILCSGVAIIGDLSASLIKRECHIKDFGNILPGHGGVLDRFDSVMFVAPLMLILLPMFPVIR
jgi:phosphatidate cytidylyltransferase